MLVKAENSENLLEFTRDRKTGQIIEEKQGEYTVNRTYDSEGNCTRITSSLGADIRHTYDREGNLQTMQAGESWQASWVRDNTGLEVQRTFSGGVTVRTERDCFGREIRKSVRSGGMEQGAYRYQWGIANRLLSKENELTGTVTRYDYDRFDFLIRQETMQGSETDVIYRVPDFVGNLFETPDKKDRKYGAGGKLLEDPDCFYHYDDEGNLIFREFKRLQETGVTFDRKRMEKERGIHFLATGTGWLYEWNSNGMLKKVIRPDGRPVEFRYDALGRRTAKQYFGKVTRWVWDGNVPIHEWSYKVTDRQPNEEENTPSKEPIEDITIWVFEADTFIPTAKIRDGKQYSIVSDYLGTPIQMYDEQGNKTWDCTLDIYGKVTISFGNSEFDCPFRFQGQYADEETQLYYNRFRFYDLNIGNYINQDPIRLFGNNPTIYGYTKDPNLIFDIWGLIVIPTYTRGPKGEILTAKATINSTDLGTGTKTNTSSIAQARTMGQNSDDAGHIIGKRLGGSGGVDNVFPQDPHINRGEFRTFEAKVAKMANTYGSVDVSIELRYANGGTRPTSIIYTAIAPDGTIEKAKFKNHH